MRRRLVLAALFPSQSIDMSEAPFLYALLRFSKLLSHMCVCTLMLHIFDLYQLILDVVLVF